MIFSLSGGIDLVKFAFGGIDLVKFAFGGHIFGVRTFGCAHTGICMNKCTDIVLSETSFTFHMCEDFLTLIWTTIFECKRNSGVSSSDP